MLSLVDTHDRAEWCKCVWTGSRSTGMWHKADISISTGIPPTIPRRRHGTTLSAETCIPVISLLRPRRERSSRCSPSREGKGPPTIAERPERNRSEWIRSILRPGNFSRDPLPAITLSRRLSSRLHTGGTLCSSRFSRFLGTGAIILGNAEHLALSHPESEPFRGAIEKMRPFALQIG